MASFVFHYLVEMAWNLNSFVLSDIFSRELRNEDACYDRSKTFVKRFLNDVAP